MAVMTTPRKEGESLDDFVYRVLQVERVQDQESQTARDRGTEIHLAVENYFLGAPVNPEMLPWIEPAVKAICQYGSLVATETILVGEGFAGRTDLILETPAAWWVFDTKSTKSLPDPKKGSWDEHRMQLSAYAAAWSMKVQAAGTATTIKPVRTANCYISTIEQGKFVICENPEDWRRDYEQGFRNALWIWQYLKGYSAKQ
jgi:hypothetical protein